MTHYTVANEVWLAISQVESVCQSTWTHNRATEKLGYCWPKSVNSSWRSILTGIGRHGRRIGVLEQRERGDLSAKQKIERLGTNPSLPEHPVEN